MAKLVWDDIGDRYFETGVSKGVLYPVGADGKYTAGLAWNGLTAVTESPSGAEATPLYADNIKYLSLTSAEEFGATIEAYTYPDEFAECDGSAELVTGVLIGQQSRKSFGLAYTTRVGNDVDGDDHGYKIHIIYGAKASPSERAYQTVNDTPEAITFSWEITTIPIDVDIENEDHRPTATLVIDSTKVLAADLTAIEDALFGTELLDPTLLTPKEIVTIIST